MFRSQRLLKNPFATAIAFIFFGFSSSFADPIPEFSKQTYISKVGIYDKDKNLIAVAKLATPVKKTEERDLTFKLKLDI